MNINRSNPIQADPASPEPFAARVESCICCGGGAEPDPTDDNLRALRRLRDLALAVAEKLAARIVDDDAPAAPGDAPKQNGKLPATVLAFQRAERGVRQCILLSNRLHVDRLARATQNAAISAETEPQRQERRKSQVARPAKEATGRDVAERGTDRLEKPDMRIDEEGIENDLGHIADSAIIDRLSKDYRVEAPLELRAEPSRPASSEPEPDNPHTTRMKARLAMAIRSGAWLTALQMDPTLTSYVRSRLIDSS